MTLYKVLVDGKSCPYCGRPDGRDYLCLPASCGRRAARHVQRQIGLTGDGARLAGVLRGAVHECRRLADARGEHA